jgi:hypothetical protein
MSALFIFIMGNRDTSSVSQEILAALKAPRNGRRRFNYIADLLREYDDSEIFETLFPLSIKAQELGLYVSIAANVLNILNPKCPIPAIDAFEQLLEEWDVSIEEAVFYLGKQFSEEEVNAALETLRTREREHDRLVRLRAITYWLQVLPSHVEKEAKMAAVALPPRPDEEKISEPDRVIWMLLYYLQTPAKRVRAIDDNGGIVYYDNDGNPWYLVIPNPQNGLEKPFLYRYHGTLLGEDNIEVTPPLS